MTENENVTTINALSDFIKSVINLLHDIENPVETLGFDPSKTIADLSICLNSEASKFALTFKPPTIAENASACDSFLNRLAQITLICKGVPLKQGKYFRYEILTSCKNVLRASICLANSFLDQPIPFEGDSQKLTIGSLALEKEFLASTGVLWNECEGLKNLPKSNKEASQKRFSDVIILVDDAIYEIQELLDHHLEAQTKFELDPVGSAQDFKELCDDFEDLLDVNSLQLSLAQEPVVKKSLSLMKVVKLLFGKILKRSINESDPAAEDIPEWLDLLVDGAKKASNSVDDLGASLWERNNNEALSEAISNLASSTNSLSKLAASKSDSSHLSWFERCIKQVSCLESELLVEASGW